MSDILYDMLSEEALPANEHWMVMSGAIELTVDDRAVRLAPEDIALLRANTRRPHRLSRRASHRHPGADPRGFQERFKTEVSDSTSLAL